MYSVIRSLSFGLLCCCTVAFATPVPLKVQLTTKQNQPSCDKIVFDVQVSNVTSQDIAISITSKKSPVNIILQTDEGRKTILENLIKAINADPHRTIALERKAYKLKPQQSLARQETFDLSPFSAGIRSETLLKFEAVYTVTLNNSDKSSTTRSIVSNTVSYHISERCRATYVN